MSLPDAEGASSTATPEVEQSNDVEQSTEAERFVDIEQFVDVEQLVDVEQFIELSVTLTGFNAAELIGTTMAGVYHAWVCQQVDPGLYTELTAASADGCAELDEGPVRELARSICHLWYLGVWPCPDGHEHQTAPTVISGRAYAQGLVWRSFGAHAPGAGAPGYGSWGEPPAGAIGGEER
ncbi:hypothetical protein [Streptomyces sp. NPDC059076]|uniref:hypothetical protein n=1 Tax=unclassified Streptomyces TaxID=2593676 RepID=UPI003690A456